MNITYILIAITLVFIVSSEAYPYSFYTIDDDSQSSSTFVRKDIFDPYGFNSILTRFVKRDIPRKPIIDLIEEDEEDAYDYV